MLIARTPQTCTDRPPGVFQVIVVTMVTMHTWNLCDILIDNNSSMHLKNNWLRNSEID